MALVLLWIIAFSKFELEHHLASTSSGLQGELKTPSVAVLLLGSSHMRQSIDVAQLQSEIGRDAFVVSYNGLDSAAMELLLNEIIARSSELPKLLVLDGYCELYSHPPDIEDDRLFFDAPPSMKMALLRSYSQEAGGWRAWPDLWELTVNRGSDTILAWPFVHTTLDRLSYRGGYHGKIVVGSDPELFSSYQLSLTATAVDPQQMTALHRIIQTARRHGVGVLMVDAPMPEPVEREIVVQKLRNQLIDAARQNGVFFYDGTSGFPNSDPSMFGDSNHLSTAGRALYTHRFAQLLNEHESDFGLDRGQFQ